MAVEIISDGFHVDVPVLRLVNRMKPCSQVILVSDSIPPCGLRDGSYRFAESRVFLRNGRVAMKDGTLAGSALSLDRALYVQVRHAGVSLRDAVLYSTLNPARLVGLARHRGSIAPGRRADLVLFDDRLRVRATWLAGQLRT